MRETAFLAALFTFFAAWASASYAWWLTVRIEPVDTTYGGAPLGALSAPLAALTLLSCEDSVATFSSEHCDEVRTNRLRFEVFGDFNNDLERDVARVGVAELMDGSLARVLLIGPKGQPEQHQILVLPLNGFSALYDETHLEWYQCMECGHRAEIKWDATQQEYVLDWGEDYG